MDWCRTNGFENLYKIGPMNNQGNSNTLDCNQMDRARPLVLEMHNWINLELVLKNMMSKDTLLRGDWNLGNDCTRLNNGKKIRGL